MIAGPRIRVPIRLNGGVARDVSAGSYLQTFIVSAVSSLLITRFYLALAGYPQIGGGGLHIAHVMWGGLLMLVALVLLVAAIGNAIKRVAAAVGGIGFGLFIDELGKFISAETDYFFQPAMALIYILFVVLFFVFRAIERRSISSETLLANAANEITELILDGANETEVARALQLLDRSGVRGPLADGLRAAIAGAVAAPDRPPSVLSRLNTVVRRWYEGLIAWHSFQRAIVGVFLVQALGGTIATLVAAGAIVTVTSWDASVVGVHGTLELGSVASSLVSLVLVIFGTMRLPRSRLAAYRWFERSVLVAILCTQVILFWQQQLAAVSGLIWNLALLTALNPMIRQEAVRVAAPPAGSGDALARHPTALVR